MNVASLNLCTELFELSGWDDEDIVYHWISDLTDNSNPYLKYEGSPLSRQLWLPAYDLGYLLRKLPGKMYMPDAEVNAWLLIVKLEDGYQGCYQDDHGVTRKAVSKVADTPEDAAASLAIALFKQGVLHK